MNKLAYLLAAGAIALPAAYVATRPTSAIAARPAAAPQAVALNVADQRPLDADYVVPGVLDNRSWKPAYDQMPAVHTVAAVRRARRPIAARETIAVQPALPSDAPIGDAEPASPDVPQN